jgi:hypothetical protein
MNGRWFASTGGDDDNRRHLIVCEDERLIDAAPATVSRLLAPGGI